jgi:hypothetical protein
MLQRIILGTTCQRQYKKPQRFTLSGFGKLMNVLDQS